MAKKKKKAGGDSECNGEWRSNLVLAISDDREGLRRREAGDWRSRREREREREVGWGG